MLEATANTQLGSVDPNIAAAYEFFNDTSRQLSNTYQLLHVKVEQLTQDLNTVSAQKDQELEKKNQLASRMQALLNFLPGGVIVLDAHGVVVQSNPAARELLQHPLDGDLWRDLIASRFLPRGASDIDLTTSSGRRISLATASLDDEGQIILLTDQTETVRLQVNGHGEDGVCTRASSTNTFVRGNFICQSFVR
jgi:two-component system sensor histidine kinase FlrB